MRAEPFATALLNPDAPLPPGLHDPKGRPAPMRFAVYRNNVAVSLTKALEDGFPLVRRIVGETFFAAMAGVFLRAHPPTSPVLAAYGAQMPGFLAAFPPVTHLGYLPDVARLELAMRESYHAQDATLVDQHNLAQIAPEVLLNSRLRLAPSLRLIRSDWPVHSIWRATAAGGPKPVMRPEDVVILRPAFDPALHLLPTGGADLIAALLRGDTLGAAVEAAPHCDVSAVLALLVPNQAIVEVLS